MATTSLASTTAIDIRNDTNKEEHEESGIESSDINLDIDSDHDNNGDKTKNDNGDDEENNDRVVSNKSGDDVTTSSPSNEHVVTLLFTLFYLSIFSVLGESLRAFTEAIFGGSACDPSATVQSTITWHYEAATNWNTCITQSGTALFVDLPANMVGSFLMGLFQPCYDLGLNQVKTPISFLPVRHWFQKWHVAHLALRTGFCGSLTTFASWNTSMIQLIDGTTYGNGALVFQAIFGYIIGLEASLASLVLGQNVGVWIHRRLNPKLAEVEDLTSNGRTPYQQRQTSTRQATKQINQSLPDFERRYLDSLLEDEELEWAEAKMKELDDLERWKESTEDHRKAGANNEETELLHTAINEIEKKILVDGDEPDDALKNIANEHNWDIESLLAYAETKLSSSDNNLTVTDEFNSFIHPKYHTNYHGFIKFCVMYGPIILACGIIVSFGYVSFKGKDNVVRGYYQSSFLSALMAPIGTIIRWKLSSLNGKFKSNKVLKWFPTGTFVANIAASLISVLTAALLVRSGDDDPKFVLDAWETHILVGIKTGFAGSLSTVSTFVAEGDKLQKIYWQRAKGYYYMILSLVIACVLSLIIYMPIVRAPQ